MTTSNVAPALLSKNLLDRQLTQRSQTSTAGKQIQEPAPEYSKPTVQDLLPGTQQKPVSGFASSIMSDGGLNFLRSHMEKQLGGLFDESAKLDENVAANDPEAFLDPKIDVSAESTATRIVGFALGLMDVFQRQNPDMSKEDLRLGFEKQIRQGVADGFDHARNVLGDIGALEGDISNNVDLTWDLVQQKLDDFFGPAAES